LEGWSALYSFKALKSGVDWSPRMAVFGDLGSVNAKSLSYLVCSTCCCEYIKRAGLLLATNYDFAAHSSNYQLNCHTFCNQLHVSICGSCEAALSQG